MDQFYALPEHINGDQLKIVGEEAHHLRDVMRAKVGDPVQVVDGLGHIFETSIIALRKTEVECRIEQKIDDQTESAIEIHLAQALPKGKKMEEIIRHGTEIGLRSFLPMTTERTEIVYRPEKWDQVHDRWQRIAISAMKQSGRSVLPQIQQPQSLTQVLQSKINIELKMIASVFDADQTIRDILNSHTVLSSLLICIGPEGGFSQNEVDQARKNGFLSLSLGKRRLRTESAGLVAAGIFAAYYDR